MHPLKPWTEALLGRHQHHSSLCSALSACCLSPISLSPIQAAQGISQSPQLKQTPTMLGLPYKKFPVERAASATNTTLHLPPRSLLLSHSPLGAVVDREEPVPPLASPTERNVQFSECRDTGALMSSYSIFGLSCLAEQEEKCHATSCYAGTGLSSLPEPSQTNQKGEKAHSHVGNAGSPWEMCEIQLEGRPQG